jgi:hypothetical protein
MVPCEIEKYLSVEYGKYENWAISNPINYSWENLERNYSRWPDEEWASVHKVYKANGELNIDDTLFHLNRVTNFNMTKERYLKLLESNSIRELLKL